MKLKFALWLLALWVGTGRVFADAPATDPSVDDPPAPAAMAPTYLALGKDLRLRLILVRRTLDDLSLDPSIKQQAEQLVDSAKAEIQYLIGEIQAGRMPSNQRLMAVPTNLRAARAKLMQIIGPDQGQLLDEKLQSLRGEARQEIGQLRQGLEDLKPAADEQGQCDTILAETDKAVESLPDTDEVGDDYARDRQKMNDLFSSTHDRLAAVLSPGEQTALGPRFSEMAAKTPATQPS
jgi:hypothetical protein